MFGSSTPGITTHRTPKRMALDDTQMSTIKKGGPILIKSDTTDSGHTNNTHTLRPGGVFVEETGSTGYYVPVNDLNWANISKGTVATISSLIAGGATTASKVLKLYRNGVQVASVTFAAGDDTTAELVTALNNDASFRNHAKASGIDGAVLVITDEQPWLGSGITAEINLDTFFAVDIGTSSIGHGKSALPDVRVIAEEVGMLDSTGTAIAGACSDNYVAGNFKSTQLVIGGTKATALADIPAWVRGILESRGSKLTA